MTPNELRIQGMSSNQILKLVVSSFRFVDIGTIKEINGNFITVSLPYQDANNQEQLLHNVELLRLGNSIVSINITPAEGDCVLVFCARSNWSPRENVHQAEEAKNSLPYGKDNFVAVQVQQTEKAETSVSVDITDDGAVNIATEQTVDVTIAGDATITCDGSVTLDASDVTVCGHLKVTK